MSRGVTVLLSSRILAEAEALCDRVSIIRRGGVVETGTLAPLRLLTRTAITADVTVAPIGPTEVRGVHAVRVVPRDGMSRVTCEVDTDALDPVPAMLTAAGCGL